MSPYLLQLKAGRTAAAFRMSAVSNNITSEPQPHHRDVVITGLQITPGQRAPSRGMPRVAPQAWAVPATWSAGRLSRCL
jgi:hypothetical protein